MIWVAWLFSAALCFIIAEKKGKNPILWGVLGLLFGVFALFVIASITSDGRFGIIGLFRGIGYAIVGALAAGLIVSGPVGWLTGAGIAQIGKLVVRAASGETNIDGIITTIGGLAVGLFVLMILIGISLEL